MTIIEDNWLHCCGEDLKAVFKKSGRNRVIGDIFCQSCETRSLCHGNDVAVKNDVFFDNCADQVGDKPQTV